MTDYLDKQIAFVDIMQQRQLSLQNENLLIKEKWKIVNKISISKLFCIFIIWDCTFSTRLINALHDWNVSIYLLSYTLKPRFLIWEWLQWNYVLREKQYKQTIAFPLAKEIIKHKICNQILLLKWIREKDDELKKVIATCTELYSKIVAVDNADSLRWYEWTIAKLFFIHYYKSIWWYKRMPRTRNDIPNLLLDIWYTIVYNIIEAHCNLYGFDIYKWVYHTWFYERKSLVCDLVEPFRCLIDRQLRKSRNLWQIDEKEFIFKHGEYAIKNEHRVKYLKMFIAPVLAEKEKIFQYVKSFYSCIMSEEASTLFPFYIKE